MKIKDEIQQKRAQALQARVKKKLLARPKAETTFDFDDKMLVHYNVDLTPENLASFDTRIAQQILHFDKLSQREWEEFLREYVVYSAIQGGLNDFSLCFKSSFIGTGEKGCVEINFVMLSAEYLLRPNTMEELVDMLDTIDHELTHIKDENNKILTYQKFDNEKGFLPRAFVPSNFDFLQSLLDLSDKSIVEGISNGVYYFTDWEVHARAVAAMRLRRLAKILQNHARKETLISGLQQKRNATYFADCVEKIITNEAQHATYLQNHLSTFWPEVKKEFLKAVDVLKEPVENYCDDNIQKQLILNFPADMAGLIAEPELANQSTFDALFAFLLKADCRNSMAYYEIINAKDNKRSAQMLSELYGHIAKKGPATLYNFHKAMKAAGEFTAAEFGKSAFNPKHLEKEMVRQRNLRAAQEYL